MANAPPPARKQPTAPRPPPAPPKAAAPAPAGYGAFPSAPMTGGADPNGPPVPGRLRPVPVGKTVLLSIITFGIYFYVRQFKVSGDLHRVQAGAPSTSWQVWFWLQIVLSIIAQLILYYQNTKQSNELRKQRGLQPSWTPFILACIPVVNIVAPFVWASHYNELARRT